MLCISKTKVFKYPTITKVPMLFWMVLVVLYTRLLMLAVGLAWGKNRSMSEHPNEKEKSVGK